MSEAETNPSDVATMFVAQVRDIGIPPRPEILTRVNAEMGRDEPDFKMLATTIGTDVSLVAGLIKTANSPYFGFGCRVRSVNEALIVLGLKIAGRTIAGLALRQIFPPTATFERFWSASARVARLSGWLTQNIDGLRLRADDAYTFGLFRDCGIPVLLMPFPEYRDVLKKANAETERCFTAIEDELLQTNHASIGAELATGWLLPEEFSVAIAHHHDPDSLRADSSLAAVPRKLIAVSQLAEHLIQQRTGQSQTQEWSKLGAPCLEVLNLGDEDLVRLAEGCAPVIDAAD